MTTSAGADRISILDCPVDRRDMETAVRRSLDIVERGTFGQHMAINAAKLVAYHDDPELRDTIRSCELISADGQSVVWASRILGDPLPVRVTGIDLMHALFDEAARSGRSVYILGARQEVLEQAVARLRERHPGLPIAGYRNGYFTEAEAPAVVSAIRASGADMLFVAMSSPGKERFLGRHGRDLGVSFAMGVGGAIDVVAGITRRAPAGWQALGLEWLYRMLQEPRRMGPRYLRTNTRFIAMVAREWLRQRRPRVPSAAS